MKIQHVVHLMEYERGWGSRVDEVLYFDTWEEAHSYIKEFNSKNTEAEAPNWYMVANYEGYIENDEKNIYHSL